jgi:16S rRNA (adenine1518-N6/adenine1519-N6)-dimethyltransferase
LQPKKQLGCRSMASIRKELEGYGLVPRKKWGQNFLVDRNIIQKIIRAAQVSEEDTILEVGPGLGQMTLALAQQAKKVIAVEIDPKLVEVLKQKTATVSNVEIVGQDILKVDFKRFLDSDSPSFKVVANLPYQISTPLLFRFIESREIFSALTLMIQREVAERLVAAPGRKEYGPLSIFVQLFCNLSVCFVVRSSAFFPPPKVESSVVHMTWREKPIVGVEDEEWFKKVVRGSLGYRRKTLGNALKHSGLSIPEDVEKRMGEIGIDPRRRPDTLAIEEFVRLARALKPGAFSPEHRP